MKKIIVILTGLMLSVIAFAQPDAHISVLSEAEMDASYSKGKTTTSETFIKNFIDKHGIEEYHYYINAIENGTIDTEIQKLKDKGINKDYVFGVEELKYMCELKTSFIIGGKYYVLTYKPVDNNIAQNLTRNAYLYRRDDDSMRIASTLIRNDVRKQHKYQQAFMLHPSSEKNWFVYKFNDSTMFDTPAVVLVVESWTWYPNGNVFNNTVILLMPDGNKGYGAACFEPKSSIKFAVNKIESTSKNGKLTLKYESGTIVFENAGGNIKVGGTIELDDIQDQI